MKVNNYFSDYRKEWIAPRKEAGEEPRKTTGVFLDGDKLDFMMEKIAKKIEAANWRIASGASAARELEPIEDLLGVLETATDGRFTLETYLSGQVGRVFAEIIHAGLTAHHDNWQWGKTFKEEEGDDDAGEEGWNDYVW